MLNCSFLTAGPRSYKSQKVTSTCGAWRHSELFLLLQGHQRQDVLPETHLGRGKVFGCRDNDCVASFQLYLEWKSIISISPERWMFGQYKHHVPVCWKTERLSSRNKTTWRLRVSGCVLAKGSLPSVCLWSG